MCSPGMIRASVSLNADFFGSKFLEVEVKHQPGCKHRCKQGCHDADKQRDGKPLDRTGAEVHEHQRSKGIGHIGIQNRVKSLIKA